VMLLGGRVAEEVALNQMTTGAGNDIERATDLARNMVCKWGMSESLGPQAFGKKEEQIFLGREIAQHSDYSEATAQRIDQEVAELMSGAHQRAQEIISRHQATLAALAERLLEKETLEAEEVLDVCAQALKDEGLPRPNWTRKTEPPPAPASGEPRPGEAETGPETGSERPGGEESGDDR